MLNDNLPRTIFSGYWGACHCQGIAVDLAGGFIYYSFTTKLVKKDLSGNIIGSVDGLVGHLGCIDFNERDGKVYGSLEFKNDSIGKGILKAINCTITLPDAFYCAIFDVDKIDRLDMDAEKDGIMKAVYLKDVVEDYSGKSTVQGKTYSHRYGCSGIDGTGWGIVPGTNNYRLNITYGIYSQTDRPDNDYQIIVSYDASDFWEKYARPLNQTELHTNGPEACENKFFVFTGNTTYGVQNLEYDSFSGNWFMAVYPGKKSSFPNPPMFIIDGSVPPVLSTHRVTGEAISELTLLKPAGAEDALSGLGFPLGSTGMFSIGDGRFYFSCDDKNEKGHYTNVLLYKMSPDSPDYFVRQ